MIGEAGKQDSVGLDRTYRGDAWLNTSKSRIGLIPRGHDRYRSPAIFALVSELAVHVLG